MLNVGIIGAGIISRSHLWAIKTTGACKAAAIVDVNEEKARAAAEKYGCPYFTDYRNIDISLDAVIINLPHFLHTEATCYFLNKGIHVMVEKPMANTYADCLEMIEASEKSGAKLAVGHIQRFFGANEKVKEFFENGTFGKLAMTNERRNIFYFDEQRPRWFLDKEKTGGGIIMNYGAHTLDKLFYIMNSEIAEIHSNYGNILNDFDVEGHGQVFMKFENGISSAVTFCGYHGFDVNETTFYFTNAAVRVSESSILEITQNGKFEKIEILDEQHPFGKQLIEFIKYINGEESRIADGKYSAKIIKTLERIYQK